MSGSAPNRLLHKPSPRTITGAAPEEAKLRGERHVHALLTQRGGEVLVRNVIERQGTAQKAPLWLRLQNPGSVTVPTNLTQSEGEVRPSTQFLEQLIAEGRLFRLAVVDSTFVNGCFRFPIVRPRVVVEAAVQQGQGIRHLLDIVQLTEVPVNKLPNRIRNGLRVPCIDVRSNDSQALQEIATVNEDRHFGHTSHLRRGGWESAKKSPKGSASLVITELKSVRECGVLPRSECQDLTTCTQPSSTGNTRYRRSVSAAVAEHDHRRGTRPVILFGRGLARGPRAAGPKNWGQDDWRGAITDYRPSRSRRTAGSSSSGAMKRGRIQDTLALSQDLNTRLSTIRQGRAPRRPR